MGVVALNFARPPLQRARREGPRAVCLSGALILLGALGLILFQLPVVVVLVILALLGAAVFTPWRTPATAPPDPERPREEGTA